MTQRTTTPAATAPDAGPDATRATRALLACGVVAGPLFALAWVSVIAGWLLTLLPSPSPNHNNRRPT